MVSSDWLRIQTVPCKLEIHSDYGSVQYTAGNAQFHMTREKGGLEMHSTPSQLKIDTFEARSSIRPTVMQAVEQNAQKGKEAALEATATYAQQGKRAMEAPIGEELITTFAEEARLKNVKLNVGLDFIPKAPAKFEYTPRTLDIHFEADRLHFDWQVSQPHFDLHRAHADIAVAQRPKVDIESTAPKIRTPLSANPNHKPLDRYV